MLLASDFLPEEFNVATHFVDRELEARANRTAFLCADRELTYGEVAELVNRSGNALLELGVARGDRVLMVCLDAPEFLGTFWGAIKVGAVPVPVNTLLRSQDYAYLLNDSAARAAVISAPLWPEVAPALEHTRHPMHVLVAGAQGHDQLSFEDRLQRASKELEPAPTSRDDPAFWLYSSGSTGFPKGAVHLQHDMVICLETYAKQVLGIRPTDRVYSAAKLFFAYGLGNALYFPMGVGAESVLFPGRPTAQSAFEVISSRRPTLFFGVPTLYAGMLAVKDAEARFDLSSLRLCVSAGEALPEDLYRRWRHRFGVEIVDGIGTTECLQMFISNRPGAVRPGSSGHVVPGYEAELVDEGGRPVPPGDIGNLRIKGDSTMALYWNQPEKTQSALDGLWIATGDKLRQDPDGTFWYCGRSDDMLKVGGIWVAPAEVEAALVRHPAVLEAAVVGQEDADGLVKPKAFVVLQDKATASDALAQELQAFVKDQLAPYKYPRVVEFLEELPKTATGKIQRFKLRPRPPSA
jgi:benzoate-CoA ligase family protein